MQRQSGSGIVITTSKRVDLRPGVPTAGRLRSTMSETSGGSSDDSSRRSSRNNIGESTDQLKSEIDRPDKSQAEARIEEEPRAQTGFRRDSRKHSTSNAFRSVLCCCGPGKKRYLIALLCSIGLTIVIGMRAEMLGIMANLKNNNTIIARGADQSRIFKPSQLRTMSWTSKIDEDFVENSVFFAYLIASPIGGYMTVRHDSSLLLGCSVAMTCGLNLFLPLVETIGQNLRAKMAMIILLRLLQGLAEGCLIPAVFGVLRFWGPESERSTLLCLSVIGVSLGPLIGLPVCAEIESKWGWGVVFYIYANIGLVWCIFWWRLVDEKPTKDKHVSKHELAYLESSIAKKVLYSERRLTIPWKAIFHSRPVYAILFTYAADDWTFQISSVCMQSYYRDLYKADVDRTIFMLSFPFLSRSLFVPIGGFLADFVKLKTSLSWTAIRKIFAGLGFGLKAIFFVALGFATNEVVATVLLSLALGFSGLAVAGYAVNVIDLAPNFAGLVMGFANSISTLTGLLSTVFATLIVTHSPSNKSGWQIAMCVAAFLQIFAVALYLVFCDCEEQTWTFDSKTVMQTQGNENENESQGYQGWRRAASRLQEPMMC